MEEDIREKEGKRQQLHFRAEGLRTQQRETQMKRARLSRELEDIRRRLSECKNIESQIAAVKAKADALERDDRTKTLNQQMAECQATIQRNTKAMDKLNAERQSLQSQSEEMTALRIKSESYHKAKRNFNASSNAIQSKLTAVLPAMPSPERLEGEFKVKQKALQSAYEQCQSQFNEMETRHKVAQSQAASLRTEADKLKRSLDQNQRRLRASSQKLGEDPNAAVEAARELAKTKSADLALAKCGRTLYSKFNNLAKKKHQCPVCQRRFGSDSELQQFVKINTKRIDTVEKSGAIAKHEKDAQEAHQRLEALQSMVPIWERTKQQQQELQHLNRDQERISKQTAKLGEELEELFAQKIERKSAHEKATTLRSNVDEICRQFKELQILKKEHDAMDGKMKRLTQHARTLKEVNGEFERLYQENNAQNKKCSKLRTQINEFDARRRRAQHELIGLEKKSANFSKLSSDRERVRLEIDELTKTADTLPVEVAKIESEMLPLQQMVRDEEARRKQARSQRTEREGTLQEALNRFTSDIRSLQSKVEEFKRSSQSAKQCGDDSQRLREEEAATKRLKEEYEAAETERRNTEKWLDSVGMDKLDLMANLEYRRFKRQYEAEKGRLKALKEEMVEIAPNAESIGDEIESTQIKVATMQSNLDQSKGALDSEKRKATQLLAQLKTPRYQDIEEKHRHQLIKHEATLIAYKDLDQFEKALDKSLIEFHSLKMREINSVLKELWQQTYRGKDIDFIEIVSEIGSTAATKRRKTYNYNVVMHQGDAKLPMRGRCSAGQRVLASLLIRLALAETFCLNCGVLALDEPTTNLDSKNIEALAYALNQIITRRKKQENFQLILITHDSEFVEKLGQREHTDGYYRVFKDDFNHSKAKLYKFHEPMRNRGNRKVKTRTGR